MANPKTTTRFAAAALLIVATLASAEGTPLDDFKSAMAEPLRTPLPPFSLTWNEDSDAAQRLYDKDWPRYQDRRKREAERHEHFLRQLTGEPRLELNEYGRQVDTTGVDHVTLTPAAWLAVATDQRHPHRHQYAAWGRYETCVPAAAAYVHLETLHQSAENAYLQTPSVSLDNFRKATAAAKYNLHEMIQGTATTDQISALRAFLDRYAR